MMCTQTSFSTLSKTYPDTVLRFLQVHVLDAMLLFRVLLGDYVIMTHPCGLAINRLMINVFTFINMLFASMFSRSPTLHYYSAYCVLLIRITTKITVLANDINWV